MREPRFYTLMAVASALMAVLFVMLGLYGLISCSVPRRRPEIGIRLPATFPHGARQASTRSPSFVPIEASRDRFSRIAGSGVQYYRSWRRTHMEQTDTSNRFVLGLLAVLGAVLAIVGWFRFLA